MASRNGGIEVKMPHDVGRPNGRAYTPDYLPPRYQQRNAQYAQPGDDPSDHSDTNDSLEPPYYVQDLPKSANYGQYSHVFCLILTHFHVPFI